MNGAKEYAEKYFIAISGYETDVRYALNIAFFRRLAVRMGAADDPDADALLKKGDEFYKENRDEILKALRANPSWTSEEEAYIEKEITGGN